MSSFSLILVKKKHLGECHEKRETYKVTANLDSLIFNIQDGMFVPLFPNHHVLGRSDHQCFSGEIRMIQCIDEHGAHKYVYASHFYFTCNIYAAELGENGFMCCPSF